MAVRKTEKGAALKRWFAEGWKNQDGKPCGSGSTKGTPYCRPTKRVSSKTPKTKSEMGSSEYRKKVSEKQKVGLGRRVKPAKRKSK